MRADAVGRGRGAFSAVAIAVVEEAIAICGAVDDGELRVCLVDRVRGVVLLRGQEVAAEGIGELEVGSVCARLPNDGRTARDDVPVASTITQSAGWLRP